jgi:UDP-glucose 4-epimerase
MSGVLVTGATQPLGYRLLEKLVDAGVEPLLGAGLEPSGEVPDGVAYVQVDLSRSRATRSLMQGAVREREVSTIVHLAFHRAPHARRSRKLHVDATRLLLRMAEDQPSVTRFVMRSHAEVYATPINRPDLVREDQPVNLSRGVPQWVHERVEADVNVCTRMGMADLDVAVLRCAEILAPNVGSQLYDYLESRVCLRPMGFDPMLNLLSLEDTSEAFLLAARNAQSGVFNIPGADTLPLSRCVERWGRSDVPVPGPMLGPLYRMRSRLKRTAFQYDLNRWRFHFNGMLDGTRAREVLGYQPQHPIDWPC